MVEKADPRIPTRRKGLKKEEIMVELIIDYKICYKKHLLMHISIKK